jgi:curved DNA-binding protein CbpA
MSKYFSNPATLEELKKQYKALALKYHPDKGGDTATMQAINNEYESLFAYLKDTHRNKDGEIYTAREPSEEAADEYINIINELIKLDGVIIEICGRFLWLSGNTFAHKKIIKALRFRWSHDKKAWYLSPQGYRRSSRHDWTMQDIRERFGSEFVHRDREAEQGNLFGALAVA